MSTAKSNARHRSEAASKDISAATRSLARRSAETRAALTPAAGGDPAPVDYGPLADWAGFHLRLAQTASFAAFAREAQGQDVSPGRFAMLMLIGKNPGIGPTALSRANGRDKSTMTPALEDLVRKGLVDRQRTREDKRAYRLTLTAAGEDVLRKLTECAKRHDGNLDRIIGARDRARFLRILRKIATELS